MGGIIVQVSDAAKDNRMNSSYRHHRIHFEVHNSVNLVLTGMGSELLSIASVPSSLDFGVESHY